MKYTHIAILAALLGLQSCANHKSDNTYTLNGEIKGISTGIIKLQRMDDSSRNAITFDSVQIENGSFTLEGIIDMPQMTYVRIEPGNWSASFFVEPGDLTLVGDTTGAAHYDYTAYGEEKGAVLKNFAVRGSVNQDAYQAFENHPKSLSAKETFTQLNKKYEAAATPETKEAVREEMGAYSEIHRIWQLQWIDSLINKKPSLVAGAYLLQRYQMFNESMPVQDLDQRLQIFVSPAKESAYVRDLTKTVATKNALLPGNDAPDFSALKTDSTRFELSSLRGQYVLLDFWASWCVPCRKAIPHWKDIYATYHNKGLEIVGVTNDSRWSDWFKALDQEQMPWIQVADDFPVERKPARIATLYDIPSLPTYVLIDKTGKIVIHTTSKEEIDKKLQEAFH